jgi:GT2 family glycosyltransferase
MGLREGRPAPSGWAVAERVLLGSPLEDAYGACATCSQMARTSTYRALGGFDANFRRSEDSDLVLRLAKAEGHFVGIERPLVLQNMTKSMDKSLAGEKKYMLMLLDKHRDVADQGGLYDYCRRWIDIKQAWLEGRKAAFIGALAGLALRHPLQTSRRLALAIPKIGVNRAFGRFHTRMEG